MENNKMFVTDKHNEIIEVTDLDAAIEQANYGRSLTHIDPEMRKRDAKLNAYWQDVYDKLLTLKSKNTPQ